MASSKKSRSDSRRGQVTKPAVAGKQPTKPSNGKSLTHFTMTLTPDRKLHADIKIHIAKKGEAGVVDTPTKEILLELSKQVQKPKSTVLIPNYREIQPVVYCDLKESQNFVRRSERILDRVDQHVSVEKHATVHSRHRNTPPRQAAQRGSERRRQAELLLKDNAENGAAGRNDRQRAPKLMNEVGAKPEDQSNGTSYRKLNFNDEEEEVSEVSSEEDEDVSEASSGSSSADENSSTSISTSVEEEKTRTSSRAKTLKGRSMNARQRLMGKEKRSSPKKKNTLESEESESEEAEAEAEENEEEEEEESDLEESNAETSSDEASNDEAEPGEQSEKSDSADGVVESSVESDNSQSSDEESAPIGKKMPAKRSQVRNGRRQARSSEDDEEEEATNDSEEETASELSKKTGNKRVAKSVQTRSAASKRTRTSELDEEYSQELGVKSSASGVKHRISESFDSNRKRSSSATKISSSSDAANSARPSPKRLAKYHYVLLISSFEPQRKEELETLAKRLGMEISEDCEDNRVTHVVVPQPKRHVKCRRTFKVLAGLAKGIPIVCESWLKECQRKNRACNVVPYVLTSIFPGIEQHRKRGGRGLLAGLAVHVMDKTCPEPEDIRTLILLAGGEVADSLRSCDLSIGPEESFRAVRKRKIPFLADSSFLDALQFGELPPLDSMEL